MPPERHALLSASSSHRWIHCPPSARLCESFEDKSSDYAAEGTDAHALCEYKLRRALHMKLYRDPTEDLTWYDAEMEEAAEGYATFVTELVEEIRQEHGAPLVLIEQKLDYSRYVKEGFGTGDCIVIAEGMMHVIDFKYGRGVQVDAEQNPQMMLYSLAALDLYDRLFDTETVSMTIYQPRLANISTWTVSRQELTDWAEKELMPAAELAWEGKGEFSCGEWCRFCKAKANCRERAEANMALARYEFKKPPLLSDEEIAEILIKADELSAWAADVSEYALREAVNGRDFLGWKLVEGRANRRYTDEAAVAKTVIAAGYEPYEEKLLGVTAMQRMLGKKKFEELIGDYIERPQGRPTLVPESDRRPAINNIKMDFTEDMTNDDQPNESDNRA